MGYEYLNSGQARAYLIGFSLNWFGTCKRGLKEAQVSPHKHLMLQTQTHTHSSLVLASSPGSRLPLKKIGEPGDEASLIYIHDMVECIPISVVLLFMTT